MKMNKKLLLVAAWIAPVITYLLLYKLSIDPSSPTYNGTTSDIDSGVVLVLSYFLTGFTLTVGHFIRNKEYKLYWFAVLFSLLYLYQIIVYIDISFFR